MHKDRPQPTLASDHRSLAPCGTQWVRSLRSRLRRWYLRNGRSLPWRDAADPYHVWVSEIMLQQTTVAAVIPYYERFLAAFPTLTHLATAEEQQVLKIWEGLGYYSRARNLQAAAKVVVSKYDGRLPKDSSALQSLPGIGRYTAGAILSFGFDQPAPIVEANTLRLYSRLLGFEGDPRSAAGQKILWEFAARILPRRAAGEFNQALIDLGATVCTPVTPECSRCPLRKECAAFRHGTTHIIPRPADKQELTDLTECAVIVRHQTQCLVRLCQTGERWAGLWDFPRFPIPSDTTVDSPRSRTTIPPPLARIAAEQVKRLTDQHVRFNSRLPDIRHGVTRYRIRLICLTAERTGGTALSNPEQLRWVSGETLAGLPMSTTGRRLAQSILTAASDSN